MPKRNDMAPATKADIKSLMDAIGKLYDATELWKEQVIRDVNARLSVSDEYTQKRFQLAVEQIRRDIAGANDEQIEVLLDRSYGHDNRITRLEKYAGYIAG